MSRGRPANTVMVNAVHQVLVAQPGLTLAQIQVELFSRGHRRRPISTIHEWVKTARGWGLVDGRNMPRDKRRSAGLLLLDVPVPRRDAVVAAILRVDGRAQLDNVVGLFNLVARVRVSGHEQLRRLATRCRTVGANDVRDLIVAETGAA